MDSVISEMFGMAKKLFGSYDEAFEGLKNRDTHEDAAQALLAHGDRLDSVAHWAFGRPVMRMIVAFDHDTLFNPEARPGKNLSDAVEMMCDFYLLQPGETYDWDPDIDPVEEFESRRDFESGTLGDEEQGIFQPKPRREEHGRTPAKRRSRQTRK